jgi:nitrogen regulatory protein P-II 1
MKLVVAIIQPQQLPAVKQSLFDAQIKHLTATNVLGTAPEGAEVRSFRGIAHEVSLFQKVRLEVMLKEEMVDRAVDAIVRGGQDSGGFGIVYVTDIHDVVVVRTGERGERAVQ